MTSVMNILLSFAMTLSLLLGSASTATLNTVAESTENNSAAVAANYADDMNFSEVIGDGTCSEASDSAVCMPDSAVIGEGVQLEAKNMPAPAVEPVCMDSAVCMPNSAVIGEGVQLEAENMPAPAVDSVCLDSAVSMCDEEVIVIGEGVSEPVAINLPAPPIAE